MSLRKQTPSDFLKQIIGRPVVVKLNSGVDYRGKKICSFYFTSLAALLVDALSLLLSGHHTVGHLTEVILVNVWYFILNVFSLGVLACLDGYMNIAVEQTEEYVNGQLKNKYGDAFLRGNNGKCLYRLVLWYVTTGFNSKRCTRQYLGPEGLFSEAFSC